MICKNCNRNNPDNAAFCFHCGCPLNVADNTYNPFPSSDERTQSAENFVDPANRQNIGQQQGGYPPVSPGKPAYQTQQPKDNSMKIFLIAVISVVVVALAIFALVLVSSMNSKNNDDNQSSAQSSQSSESSESSKRSESGEEIKQNYDNITVDCDAISESELDSLQELLESKSSSMGKKVQLCVLGAPEGGAQKYADTKCKEIAGDNSVVIIVDDKTHRSGLSASGSAKDYVTNNVKKKLRSETESDFSSSNYAQGVKTIIAKLPESKNEAKALNFDPVSGSSQVVYVKKNSGSTSAKLTYVDYNGERPSVAMECDAYVGSEGITDSPRENLSATPKGENKLGMVLTTNSVSTAMNIEPVNTGDVWVTDPDSMYYNTKQAGNAAGDWSTADKLYNNFSSGKFYACILIEHNGNGYTKGEYNKGSGIYLTGKSGNLSESWGDVNISVSDMKTLLGKLNADSNPYIVVS